MEFDNKEILDFINSDVPSYQRDILTKSLNENSDSIEFYNTIGRELTGEVELDKMLLNAGPVINKASFWDKVKDEVFIFICTDDKKYQTERNLIGKNFKEVVTIMATALAATFSLGAGVVIGIITNILISIVKINQNAWCELQKVK